MNAWRERFLILLGSSLFAGAIGASLLSLGCSYEEWEVGISADHRSLDDLQFWAYAPDSDSEGLDSLWVVEVAGGNMWGVKAPDVGPRILSLEGLVYGEVPPSWPATPPARRLERMRNYRVVLHAGHEHDLQDFYFDASGQLVLGYLPAEPRPDAGVDTSH